MPYTFGQPVLGQVMDQTDMDLISQALDWAIGQGWTGLKGGKVNRPDLQRLYNFLPDSIQMGSTTFDRSYLGDILGQAADVPRNPTPADTGGQYDLPSTWPDPRASLSVPNPDYMPPSPAPESSTPFSPPPIFEGGTQGGSIGGDNTPNPFDVFNQLGPYLENINKKEVENAMAYAGFTGNRYGTSAMRKAGEVGGETGYKLGAYLGDLLYKTYLTNQSLALQAALGGGQLGGLYDTLAYNRLGALGNFGQYEQGRADDISQLLYNSYQNNQYGLLPLLIQIAAGQTPNLYGFPSATGGSGLGNASDLLNILAQIFGLFQ